MTFPIRDHMLGAEDLYAEFEDVEDPKTRYVMARKCRYTQKCIRACAYGICKELHEGTFNPLDEFHDVHVCGYDLRPQLVINSRGEQAIYAIREWRNAYVENIDVGMHWQSRVDSEFVPVDHNEYAGGHIADVQLRNDVEVNVDEEVAAFVGITQIFDCGTIDPTVDRPAEIE